MSQAEHTWGCANTLVSLAFLALTAAFFYNLASDTTEAQRLGEAAACATATRVGGGCRAQLTRWERSGLGPSFTFVTQGQPIEEPTSARQAPKRAAQARTEEHTVDVRCVRAYIVAGEYTCTPLLIR